jgi:hypothetical protein
VRAWLVYWLWRLRGRRRVRLHLFDDAPSVEGILVGCKGGHYVLLTPKLVTRHGQHELQGLVEVPRERVVFVQVLTT